MRFSSLLTLLFLSATASAGLHYRGESTAELPAQWRGFLTDLRSLRQISIPPGPGVPASELRDRYEEAAKKLEDAVKVRLLSADEGADLGALYLRLGRSAKALESLRSSRRDHPNHFAIAANLAMAWQMQGDLVEATRAQREAIRLAPVRWKAAEELHLKLLVTRQKNGVKQLDDLFDAPFPKEPTVGPLKEVQKKLPNGAVSLVQQLALWLPGDALLLWQLGELANATGDVRTAAAILEGCVSEYGLSLPEARARRKVYRAEADAIAKLPDADHAKFKGTIEFKSPRALLRQLDPASLPAIRVDGVNALPWGVVTETVIEKPFRPKFLKHLEQLDGKKISMTGFMQPVSNDFEVSGFMLVEYPIGCWFCETPDPAAILYVDSAGGKSIAVKRGRIKVEGVLKLNKGDPEDFLYTITQAKIREPD